MNEQKNTTDSLLWALQERAKELNCLYEIEELLSIPHENLEEVFKGVIEAIPPGWQYPNLTQVSLTYEGKIYRSAGFKESPHVQNADITVMDRKAGEISVSYTEAMPAATEGPFLKEERRLINTIADRLSRFLSHYRLKNIFQELKTTRSKTGVEKKAEWQAVLNLLFRTDQNLFLRISRKMLYHLYWSGFKEAENLLQYLWKGEKSEKAFIDDNRPIEKRFLDNSISFSDEVFKIASDNLHDNEILSNIQKWIHEDHSSFLIKALTNQHTPLAEINEAIHRYQATTTKGLELSSSTKKNLQVDLINRFFTDQLNFINVAKSYIDINDIYELLQRVIYFPDSQGKLGGKSAGLFLAWQILRKSPECADELCHIKVPKTWYLTSDGVLHFIHYNNLEDVVAQKYKEKDQIRQEYPYIVQLFKNSQFSPEIIKGLSVALDDLGDKPLIVRSSSLLEDSMSGGLGSSFSGKYKSLFLANRGTKDERLSALTDAIAEVYASTFSPDPIEYRAERGLLDFHEEMGVMIQEVVGTPIGDYFFPSFAGVAFTNNEFRWSARIKRDDGLIRMVPGLGTRAVDRLADDYPILIAPGQPGLRANITTDEILRYAPKKMDVINLTTNSFETIEIHELLKRIGGSIPLIHQMVSIFEGDHLRKLNPLEINFEKDKSVVTFEGLMTGSPFIKQLQLIMKVLREKLGTPVDIEFGHNGRDFYLLQCRPQSYSAESMPAVIPKDIPRERIIFNANRYISNGKVPDITHIVYIDPHFYSEISNLETLRTVGRVVGRLNKILPRHQFILMGPGRWGSRGDIRLGVNVSYSDINNTSVLIEIARKKGNYLPDLSFGTHFFQDLVESSIRYLPLYPDDKDIIFNEEFLNKSNNILPEILPEFSHLSDIIKVIDVPISTNGLILRVLLNADLEEAAAILGTPSQTQQTIRGAKIEPPEQSSEEHWRWRLRMAERIAAQLDAERFGVKGFYLLGSTKNAMATAKSDIDLLIHFGGKSEQKDELMIWLEGWSKCLAEINYLRTGFKSEGLLDVYLVTDEDISNRSGYAAKIGAVTDAARQLPLKKIEATRS